MPNLVLVSNAKFRPFSFDEMLKPALMATQAHMDLEEAYNNLDTQANAVGSLASETDDPIAYARYKAYENSLRAQAEDLAANGLNVTSRQGMLNMRSRYAKEITPIQNAIERRRKLADAQMEAYMKNPTLMFQRNFNTKSYETSLDRFLEDPDYGYGDVASGALITQQAATQAGALAKKLNGISKGKLDAYTNTFIQQYGLSPDEIAAFNNNPRDPKANRVLRAIHDNVYGTVPQSIRDQYSSNVDYYIGMGLYSAIGEDKMSTYENYGARMALQDYYRRKAKEEDKPKPFLVDSIRIGVGPKNPQAKSNLQKTMGELGFRSTKDGKTTASKYNTIYYGGVQGMKSHTTGIESPSRPPKAINFNLFVESQGHRLKTKAELLRGAKDKTEERLLGEYYDKYVTPIVKDYFGGKTTSVTRADLMGIAREENERVAKAGTPTEAEVYNFPISSGVDDLMKVTSNIGNTNVWNLGPASGNADTWTTTKKAGTLNDVLLAAKEGKKAVSTYLSTQNGKTGMIINAGGETYFLDFSDINSSLAKTTAYYIQKQEEAAAKYMDALSKNDIKTAQDYYESAANYQQSAISTAHQAVGFKYGMDTFNTSEQ